MSILLCGVYGICDIGHDIRYDCHAASTCSAPNTSLCGTGSSVKVPLHKFFLHVCTASVRGRVGQGLEETGEGV